VPEKLAVTATNLPSRPGWQDVRHHPISQTKSYLTYMHNLLPKCNILSLNSLKKFWAILNQENIHKNSLKIKKAKKTNLSILIKNLIVHYLSQVHKKSLPTYLSQYHMQYFILQSFFNLLEEQSLTKICIIYIGKTMYMSHLSTGSFTKNCHLSWHMKKLWSQPNH